MSNHSSLRDELVTLIRSNMRQYTMIAALFMVWVIFSILTGGIFLTSRNLSTLFIQMVTIGILTYGMLLVMVAGNIDLSVGSVCGTLGALVAWLMVMKGLNPFLAILITLIAGLAVGLWHGFWIASRGVVSWVVTLSSMLAFKGVTLLITKGQTIGEFKDGFKSIGQGYFLNPPFEGKVLSIVTAALFGIAAAAFVLSEILNRIKRRRNGLNILSLPFAIAKIIIVSAGIAMIGWVMASYRGLPNSVIILLAGAAAYTVITTRTRFGRHVYAIGGNLEAARLSGINVKKTVMGICISMGVMTAVAAIVFTSRLNAATTAAGYLFELDAIAACIIGGTATTGGIGTIFGALIGALFMASLDNGMGLMDMPVMYQHTVKGLVLLIAVWIDIANRKK